LLIGWSLLPVRASVEDRSTRYDQAQDEQIDKNPAPAFSQCF
jgi:hypothetical protein